MKKIVSFLFVLNATMACVAEEYNSAFLENALFLGTALGVPFVSTSQVWTTSFFPANGMVSSNDFKIIKQENMFNHYTTFNISTNEQVIAYGKLFECSSYDDALKTLLIDRVMCNMMLDAIIDSYKLCTNNVGDFAFIGIVFDATSNKEIEELSEIYFVRGAKAVKLSGKNGINVQPIAELLDIFLKQPALGL